MLDYFALAVLIVLIVAVVVIWVALGMAPGKIAKSRNHPQADAVNVCGWMGVITLGILCPLAFVWAYYNYAETSADSNSQADDKEAKQ